MYNYRPNVTYSVQGRMAGLIQSYRHIANSNMNVYLFGSGPDKFINFKARDGTERQFGIYNAGGITGLATYLLSVGLVGSTLILYLYFFVGKEVYKNIRKNYHETISTVRFFQLFVILATFIFALDFIFYTRSFVQSHALNFLYFILAGISINKNIRFGTSSKVMPWKNQIAYQ